MGIVDGPTNQGAAGTRLGSSLHLLTAARKDAPEKRTSRNAAKDASGNTRGVAAVMSLGFLRARLWLSGALLLGTLLLDGSTPRLFLSVGGSSG